MVFGALLFAIAAVITKKLIVTESTFSIMFWMNLMQLPMNFASAAITHSSSSSTPRWPCRCSASRSRASRSTTASTNAFRYGDAMVVIPMDFLRVPLVAVIGWMFYGEHLDVFVFAGAGLIIAGVLWNVRGEAQRNGKRASATRARAAASAHPAGRIDAHWLNPTSAPSRR